ncbi:hypothetical protein BD289DRAFT_109470 [Coniella lustricola]|uniref:Uncharacterized protein n=1 Tax=Coniella lustricola TaxID=2025994 RepID=A0A2T2ZXD7_9PEZI|nr:hypothetical protein BD289DRAFT_109470 [Coniella lustricola]
MVMMMMMLLVPVTHAASEIPLCVLQVGTRTIITTTTTTTTATATTATATIATATATATATTTTATTAKATAVVNSLSKHTALDSHNLKRYPLPGTLSVVLSCVPEAVARHGHGLAQVDPGQPFLGVQNSPIEQRRTKQNLGCC